MKALLTIVMGFCSESLTDDRLDKVINLLKKVEQEGAINIAMPELGLDAGADGADGGAAARSRLGELTVKEGKHQVSNMRVLAHNAIIVGIGLSTDEDCRRTEAVTRIAPTALRWSHGEQSVELRSQSASWPWSKRMLKTGHVALILDIWSTFHRIDLLEDAYFIMRTSSEHRRDKFNHVEVLQENHYAGLLGQMILTLIGNFCAAVSEYSLAQVGHLA